MHYDDGMDTQPGEDLKLGDQDLGPATYDVDGDGVADSYIHVVGDDEVEVLTDSDGDGQVDTAYEIDGDGSVTEMQGQDGQLVTVGTGHLDDSGRIQMDGTGPTTPGDGDPMPGTDTTHPDGDLIMQDGGSSVDVGAPTIDLTGDGVNDTVQLAGTDGSTVLVADADQDGQADNIVQINQDGTVTYAVSDGHGGWVVSGTGHMAADGTLTQDSTGDTGQPYQPPVDLGSGTGTDGGTDGGTGTGTDDGTATQVSTTSSGQDMTVDVGGTSYDVGAPTLDADGNGTPDTAVVQGEDGTTVLVTDVDGDGTGDQMVQINPDGSAQIQQTDGNGGWQTVATGHVAADGTLVIDQQ